MLWLNPKRVELLGRTLDGVAAVAVSRFASRLALEWTDLGPHAAFADVPEQRVEVHIDRTLRRDGAGIDGDFAPGDRGTLRFTAAPGSSDAGAETYEAAVVVTAVRHRLAGRHGPTQSIACVAVSDDGATDPIERTDTAAGGK